MLQFVSSQPSLLELRREKQGFEANESRPIELLIPPQSKAGTTAEVMIYINSDDEQGKVSETLMFKIIVKE